MKKILLLSLLTLPLFALGANAEPLEDRLQGKILLQVEQNGEAWFVSPGNKKRHFMGRPRDAFRLMNELGVGISNADLNRIPAYTDDLPANDNDSDGDGYSDFDELRNGFNPNGEGKLSLDKNFADKHRGKIFLQVESKGEAWYINPDNSMRYYLGRPSDAFNLMRKLGLGIKTSDLEKIAEAGTHTELDKSSEELLAELKEQKKIIKFASVDELSSFLEENHTVSSYGNIGIAYSGLERTIGLGDDAIAWNEAAPQSSGDAAMAKSEESASSDYSKTNIQVDGVDEADIVKTDGKYIYAISDTDLYIIDAYPAADSKIVSKIEFENRPSNIYLNDDKLVVFGQDYNYSERPLFKSFIRRNSFTFFKIFDLSDKSNPKEIKDLSFEGYYSNSRMIGDYVYFITNNYNYRYIADEPTLPRIVDGTSVLDVSCQAIGCYNPDIYYFGIPYSSYNLVSINAINIANPEEEISGDVYVLESGQEFYVSEDNIYLTYAKYLSEHQILMEVSKDIIIPRLSAAERERIQKIENTDKDVLSTQEKTNKINEILTAYIYNLSEEDQEKLQKEVIEATKKKYDDLSKELEKTVIHKIAINGSNLEYIGNGEVTGRVLNQFSMDESSDGYFRIATTKGRSWSMLEDFNIPSYNNLYILDQDLNVVGSVEGLAEGESIKSVRFMQDRAYMVTFVQVDPLFVIDVANPTNPKVLGELKIPGWSDYLHPYSDTMLIGLGKDAYENEYGRTVAGGVKVSLFDVADVSQPLEVDSYIIGESGTYSEATNNHKAFYFDKEKQRLAFPIRINEKRDKAYSETVFSGAIVFAVDDNGFELKGKISHLDDSDEINYYSHNAQINRIMHIDDKFYTLSTAKLGINEISDLSEIKEITLTEEDDIKVIPFPEPMPLLEDIAK